MVVKMFVYRDPQIAMLQAANRLTSCSFEALIPSYSVPMSWIR